MATEIRRRAEGFSATGASADGARARSPLMVALVGIPGAGKTTSARILERLLGPSCLVVPADGFHLPMADLRQRPDADDAVYRLWGKARGGGGGAWAPGASLSGGRPGGRR